MCVCVCMCEGKMNITKHVVGLLRSEYNKLVAVCVENVKTLDQIYTSDWEIIITFYLIVRHLYAVCSHFR